MLRTPAVAVARRDELSRYFAIELQLLRRGAARQKSQHLSAVRPRRLHFSAGNATLLPPLVLNLFFRCRVDYAALLGG
jgi:hypothetical protein